MKYLVYIPALLVCLGLGWFAYAQYQEKENLRGLLSATSNELTTAKLELGRAETKLANQEAVYAEAVYDLNEKVKAEIAKREALVVAYGELEGRYEAEKKKVKIKTRTKTKVVTVKEKFQLPPDKLFHMDKEGKLHEITALEFEYEDFRINIYGDFMKQTLGYKLHQKFKGKIIETKLPTGDYNHYFELTELDESGKEVGRLELDRFEVVKAKEFAPHMMWWNPKLDMMIGYGTNTELEERPTVDLGISLSSYGKTPNDINWKFFRFAAGLSDGNFSLSVAPGAYNIGEQLPLISNLWLTPFLGYDFYLDSPHFGLGIGVNF